MVKLLVEEFGDNLAKVDSKGNNVLHLAVEHQLPDMIDFIFDLWKRHGGDATPLGHRTNNEHLTPLCLAAKKGWRHMFGHLLQKSCITHWKYGPVKCMWLPLQGLDYVSEKGEENEVLCAMDHIIQEGHADLLMLPLMQELLVQKWERFAKYYFMGNFVSALVQAIL